MAESCRQQQVRLEEEVIERVDRFEDRQRRRCEQQECNPWLLCLNQLVCWTYWVALKITEIIVTLLVRWVFRLVCVVVSLVIGVLALIFTFNPDILFQAFKDLLYLVIDAALFVAGFIMFYGNFWIDFLLTAVGAKDKSRKLNKDEIALLKPIFGESLAYGLIDVHEGRLGIMGPPFATGGATTMGYSIYFREYGEVTLVHECMHVWQFQFAGTHYIGQSVFRQLAEDFGGSDPYDWLAVIGSDVNGWYLMDSVEAQAEFIENVYHHGKHIATDGTVDEQDGAFFRGNVGGRNQFFFGRNAAGPTTDPAAGALDFTAAANAAWTILKS